MKQAKKMRFGVALHRIPAYVSYNQMHQRCENPQCPSFVRYGARGIAVDRSWSTFDAFFLDMGPRPRGTEIERIDNDGPYAKWNCRWATHMEQCNNRRTSRRLSAHGKTMTIAEWSRESGIDQDTIRARLVRGWDVERAILADLDPRGRRHAVSISW